MSYAFCMPTHDATPLTPPPPIFKRNENDDDSMSLVKKSTSVSSKYVKPRSNPPSKQPIETQFVNEQLSTAAKQDTVPKLRHFFGDPTVAAARINETTMLSAQSTPQMSFSAQNVVGFEDWKHLKRVLVHMIHTKTPNGVPSEPIDQLLVLLIGCVDFLWSSQQSFNLASVSYAQNATQRFVYALHNEYERVYNSLQTYLKKDAMDPHELSERFSVQNVDADHAVKMLFFNRTLTTPSCTFLPRAMIGTTLSWTKPTDILIKASLLHKNLLQKLKTTDDASSVWVFFSKSSLTLETTHHQTPFPWMEECLHIEFDSMECPADGDDLLVFTPGRYLGLFRQSTKKTEGSDTKATRFYRIGSCSNCPPR